LGLASTEGLGVAVCRPNTSLRYLGLRAIATLTGRTTTRKRGDLPAAWLPQTGTPKPLANRAPPRAALEQTDCPAQLGGAKRPCEPGQRDASSNGAKFALVQRRRDLPTYGADRGANTCAPQLPAEARAFRGRTKARCWWRWLNAKATDAGRARRDSHCCICDA
jgi:hypothetical protein